MGHVLSENQSLTEEWCSDSQNWKGVNSLTPTIFITFFKGPFHHTLFPSFSASSLTILSICPPDHWPVCWWHSWSSTHVCLLGGTAQKWQPLAYYRFEYASQPIPNGCHWWNHIYYHFFEQHLLRYMVLRQLCTPFPWLCHAIYICQSTMIESQNNLIFKSQPSYKLYMAYQAFPVPNDQKVKLRVTMGHENWVECNECR